jgi:tetratricopeptide (TPR) repeat protein
MLTMLALGAIWRAVHEPEQRGRWLALASVTYGLAVGARPSLLLGAVILLVPVVQAWRQRRRMGTLLMAAMGPIVLIGLGLMLYNALRFDNPFEFGMRYQLAGRRQVGQQFFSLRYLWFNFRVYFLEPARWSARFPFVHEIAVPPVPSGYFGVESPFGILTNIPLGWLALVVPLAWRGRSGQERDALRRFVAIMYLFFGMCALTLGFYRNAGGRYEVEFLAALVLLAVAGILGLERALAPTSESGLADRPVWRRAARYGWGLLLGFSVAFNLLASVEYRAVAQNNLGCNLLSLGTVPEAIAHYEQALRLSPDYADAHYNLGIALVQSGKIEDAIGQYQQALRSKPDYAEAHSNLGTALFALGNVQEGLRQFEKAVQLQPDSAVAHFNLADALARSGRLEEAIQENRQALRLRPDYPEARYNLAEVLVALGRNQEAIVQYGEALRIDPDRAQTHCRLGNALARSGRLEDAIAHYERALQVEPDNAEAHLNLGAVLTRLGKLEEAIQQYQEALRIRPNYVAAHNGLANVLGRAGKLDEAIRHYEQALRIDPGLAEVHYNLGITLEKVGRVPEAIQHYEQALKLRPGLAAARNALTRLQAGK